MLDALCRRAPEVAASARRVAKRCMALVFVGNVEIFYLLLVDGYYYYNNSSS